MAHVIVKLRDTQTGEEGTHEYDTEPDADGTFESDDFMWTDGNWGCDCNRLNFLADALGRDRDVQVSCGNSRVVIVDATIDGVRQAWK